MRTPTFGLWLILAIVFAPFYMTLAGWFLSRPRQWRLPLIGLGSIIGLTALMWVGMALFAILLGELFY